MTYRDKYIKYKTKYDNLIKAGGFNPIEKYGFYITHWALNNNLIPILKDGSIKAGKLLASKHLGMSDPDDPFTEVFTMIYFKDINNLNEISIPSLILNPQILYESDAVFHNGWGGGNRDPIKISKLDEPDVIDTKIQSIKKTLVTANPNISSMMSNEILFSSSIDLQKYLLAIVINKEDISLIKKVTKLMKNKYQHIKLITHTTNAQDIMSYLS
jgi:hypothetical protein